MEYRSSIEIDALHVLCEDVESTQPSRKIDVTACNNVLAIISRRHI